VGGGVDRCLAAEACNAKMWDGIAAVTVVDWSMAAVSPGGEVSAQGALPPPVGLHESVVGARTDDAPVTWGMIIVNSPPAVDRDDESPAWHTAEETRIGEDQGEYGARIVVIESALSNFERDDLHDHSCTMKKCGDVDMPVGDVSATGERGLRAQSILFRRQSGCDMRARVCGNRRH
jgi:hypothetical protein